MLLGERGLGRSWPEGEQENRGHNEISLLGGGGHLKGAGRRGTGEQGAGGEVEGAEGELGPGTWEGWVSRSESRSRVSRIKKVQDQDKNLNERS